MFVQYLFDIWHICARFVGYLCDICPYLYNIYLIFMGYSAILVQYLSWYSPLFVQHLFQFKLIMRCGNQSAILIKIQMCAILVSNLGIFQLRRTMIAGLLFNVLHLKCNICAVVFSYLSNIVPYLSNIVPYLSDKWLKCVPYLSDIWMIFSTASTQWMVACA